jgi:MFS family permease
VEDRAPDPLIRLGLFRNKVIARGSAVSAMVIFAMMGALVFMPLYFQLVLGMSPAGSGAMILPQVGGMLLTSTIGGRFVSRLGRYRPFLLAGLGMEAFSLVCLALFAWYGAPPMLFLALMGVFGLGMGLGMPNLITAIQNAVAHSELGAATGALVFIRSLGGAVGVAASGAMMSFSLMQAHAGGAVEILHAHGLLGLSPVQRAAVAQAYRGALTGSFVMCALVMLAAYVLVLGLPDVRLRNQIGDAA